MSSELAMHDVTATLRAAKVTLALQCALAFLGLSILAVNPSTPTDPAWLGRHRLIVVPLGVVVTVAFCLLVVGVSRRNRTAWLGVVIVEAFGLGIDFARVVYSGDVGISSSTAITVVALWALLRPSTVDVFMSSRRRPNA